MKCCYQKSKQDRAGQRGESGALPRITRRWDDTRQARKARALPMAWVWQLATQARIITRQGCRFYSLFDIERPASGGHSGRKATRRERTSTPGHARTTRREPTAWEPCGIAAGGHVVTRLIYFRGKRVLVKERTKERTIFLIPYSIFQAPFDCESIVNR